MNIKGKRILKNGKTGGYVKQKDGSWKWKILEENKSNKEINNEKKMTEQKNNFFFENDDLFIGHIGGMDTLARSLLCAAKLIEDEPLIKFVNQRYDGWRGKLGKNILSGNETLESLSKYALEKDLDPKHVSGRQELLENIINRYV